MRRIRRVWSWLSLHLVDIFPPAQPGGLDSFDPPSPTVSTVPLDLLLADPAMMGSPEGDRRGLADLQREAQRAIDALDEHRRATAGGS